MSIGFLGDSQFQFEIGIDQPQFIYDGAEVFLLRALGAMPHASVSMHVPYSREVFQNMIGA